MFKSRWGFRLSFIKSLRHLSGNWLEERWALIFTLSYDIFLLGSLPNIPFIPTPPAHLAPLLLCVSLSGGAHRDQRSCFTDSIPGQEHPKMKGKALYPEWVLLSWLLWAKIMSFLKSDLLFKEMEEKHAPFCCVWQTKVKFEVQGNMWVCAKCIWSNGCIWYISLDLTITQSLLGFSPSSCPIAAPLSSSKLLNCYYFIDNLFLHFLSPTYSRQLSLDC